VNDILGSRWRPLHQLLAAMDRDIASLYEGAGVDDMRTRFVGPLIQLARHGPMTIQQLADSVEGRHSAMSQTAATMRRAGLVEGTGDTDGRTRRVQLTDRARELVPLLEAEWAATEAALAELEAELPYPLSQVVDEINTALARRSFAQRLRDHLG
jgi:DNA-binding MarR family transcriptional regulator